MELIVAVAIIGLLTMLAFMNMSGLVGKSQFQSKAQKLINLMQMACESAEKTDVKYEVLFDLSQQFYQLSEINISNVNDLTDSNVIETGEFTDDFILSYVQFDDLESTTEDVAVFRAGRTGFQFGGKIVIIDSQGQPYSLIISRINCKAELIKGDADLVMPRDKDDLPF